MGDKLSDDMRKLKVSLESGKKSISEAAEETGIDPRTAKKYLELLQVMPRTKEVKEGSKRVFYSVGELFVEESLFDLPLTKDERNLFKAVYEEIHNAANKLFNRRLPETTIQKILFKVDEVCALNLPIGWYKYGPCAVYRYQEDSLLRPQLDIKVKETVATYTAQYGNVSTGQLIDTIYQEYDKKFYQAKRALEKVSSENKSDRDIIFLDMIRYAPDDAADIVTDYARATKFCGWEVTKEFFNEFWNFCAVVCFRDSLQSKYSDIDAYLGTVIKQRKEVIQDLILHAVKSKSSLPEGSSPAVDSLRSP